MKFIHTADWQLGKPFARISDSHKRSLVQHARIEAIRQIGVIAKESGSHFVLVAGDLFDSFSADKPCVSAACSAIGQLELPVIVIPGNHDHGGPGSLWEQDFFLREQTELAPNLQVLRKPVAIELDSAVLYPCPLLRRVVLTDPTAWLRASDVYADVDPEKPRIVLAHGSTHAFSGGTDDDKDASFSGNLIDLSRLPMDEIDFVALGDWHGMKQVGPKAWYAGTHEADRFPRGADYDPGNILIVDAQRGSTPEVTCQHIGRLAWAELSFDSADDTALNELEDRLNRLFQQRTNEDLLKLTLTGTLGIQAFNRLEQIIESLSARLLRLKLDNQTLIAPSETEVHELTQRTTDPLIASVATQLVMQLEADGEDAQIARIALRQLHAACTQDGSK